MKIIPNKGYYIVQVLALESKELEETRYIMPIEKTRLDGYQKVQISASHISNEYFEEDCVIVHANTIREFDLDNKSYYMVSERDILGKVELSKEDGSIIDPFK